MDLLPTDLFNCLSVWQCCGIFAYRVLEVNGSHVVHLSESALYKLVAGIEGSSTKIVVIRLPDTKHRKSSGDIDALKEDLALALMELEALQQDNKDLLSEINRL